MSDESIKTLFEQIYVPLTPENANAIAEQKKAQHKWREMQVKAVLTKIASNRQMGFVKIGKHDKSVADVLERQGFRVLVDSDGFGVAYGYVICWDLNKYYQFVCGEFDRGYDIDHLNKMFP